MPIAVIESLERMLELEPEWNALHARASTAHLFNGFDWLYPWARNFLGDKDQLRIYTVRREGRLCAIFPAMIGAPETEGAKGMLEPRRLRSLFNFYLGRSDMLFDPDALDAPDELLTALAAERDLYDVLELWQMAEGSPTFAALERGLPGFSLLGLRNLSSPYLLTGGGSYQAWYESRFSGKKRQQDRRRQRGAEKLGGYRMEVLAEPEAVRSAFLEGVEVEDRSWKGGEGSSIKRAPGALPFMEAVVTRHARRGQVALTALTVEDKQAAFLLGFVQGDCYYFFKTGYDPELKDVSPGRLVLLRSLQDCFERGVARYDFLGGPDEYKLQCSPLLLPQTTVFAYHAGLRSRLAYALKRDLIPNVRRLRGEAQPYDVRLDRRARP